MAVYKYVLNVISRQLFARIPPEYEKGFRAHLFAVNVQRFTVQSAILVVMDIISLFVYLYFYAQSSRLRLAHIVVHLLIIAFMWIAFIKLPKYEQKGYRESCFLDRNIDVLYPVLHLICEISLFMTGPQDPGVLIRFLAVPFIVGGIPVFGQKRALLLESAMFAFYTVYLYYDGIFGPATGTGAYLFNLLGVVFPCVWLVSATVYSTFVHNYVYKCRAQQAQYELASVNEKLDYLARQDQLTQISNRRDFVQYMDDTWEVQRSKNHTVSAMMIDIDHFKKYNDRFGHLMGDDCLMKVSSAMRERLDQGAMLARYGGEEFIVVAYNRPHDELIALAERMRLGIEALGIENPDSKTSAYVTVSIGLATQAVQELEHYKAIIEWADDCLYVAKHNGRNQLVHTQGTRDAYRTADGQRIRVEQASPEPDNLVHGEELQRILNDVSADCTFVYSRKQKRITFSQSATDLFCMPNIVIQPTVEKMAEYIHIAPEDREKFIHLLSDHIKIGGRLVTTEARIEMGDTSRVWISIRAQCAYTEGGELDLMYGSMFNIQKVMQFGMLAQEQLRTSSITGLKNRMRFYEDVAALQEEDCRVGTIIFLDIRNFKEINGVYSHSIGDKVLHVVARRLTRLTQEYGELYNYATDQFICNVLGCSQEEIRELMSAIQEDFQNHPLSIDGLELQVGFAIVAVEYACGRTTVDELMMDIDIAIHSAKLTKGRDAFFFSDQDRAGAIERFNVKARLRQAVDNGFNGFLLYYQPIWNREGRCVGAEALLRWQDEDAGETIMPDVAIPLLEQSGLMACVEGWLLGTVCCQCKSWLAQNAPEGFSIHINLSSDIIGRSTLPREVLDAVQRYGLEPRNIVLEVTEDTIVAEMKSAVNNLHLLRKQGVRIAIDDFGTGYSSLSYLVSLPADTVKIDRSFVAGVDKDPLRKGYMKR
ncbi:diguanylate cyclase [Christensenellaceae bacterium OttesenSCG-928-K19]|nr:diguanylate cyclase [Christensenellaceae bacterium OttesenSCG-928-K19]